jgi:hypothetical protein
MTLVLELPDTLNRVIKRMNKIIFIITLCFYTLANAEPEDNGNTAETNSEQTEAQKNKQAATTINTPDSFDPTETLSQDVPAAFPIDI